MSQPNSRVTFEALPDQALVRLQFLIAWSLLPFSTSTLWRKCRSGEFPAPVKVSSQVTAWRVEDLRLWLSDPENFSVRYRQSQIKPNSTIYMPEVKHITGGTKKKRYMSDCPKSSTNKADLAFARGQKGKAADAQIVGELR